MTASDESDTHACVAVACLGFCVLPTSPTTSQKLCVGNQESPHCIDLSCYLFASLQST